MSVTNEEQIAYWNEQGGPKWVQYQELLDAQMNSIMNAGIAAAGIRRGMAVLDIGCGCGATSLELGRIVGPDGRVVGIDLSVPMLARAADRAAAEGLSQVSFVNADAQVAELEGEAFDRVFSRFGVMFFEDPVKAFANIRSSMKPGGELCFLCWRPIGENPWIAVPLMAAGQVIELPAPPDPDAPGPFAFADKNRVHGILEQAGFVEIAINPHDEDSGFAGASIDETIDFLLRIGPVSRVLVDADDPTREAVSKAVREAVEPYLTPDGLMLARAMWMVNARNPGA